MIIDFAGTRVVICVACTTPGPENKAIKNIRWKHLVFCYQNCSDLLWEKNVLGQEFAKSLRSLEQFVRTVKGQNNFW